MPERSDLPGGTVLAFDYGERRIGVAVGECQIQQAHPLTTLHRSKTDLWTSIAQLIAEWRPERLVVGRPVALDGTPHSQTARCEHFARQLQHRFRIVVDYAEERLSSFDAEQHLRVAGHNALGARTYLDSVAAQLILQSYFEASTGESGQRSSPGGNAAQ